MRRSPFLEFSLEFAHDTRHSRRACPACRRLGASRGRLPARIRRNLIEYAPTFPDGAESEDPGQRPAPMGKNIYVGNLPFDTTGDDLVELFQVYGPVTTPRSSSTIQRAEPRVRVRGDGQRRRGAGRDRRPERLALWRTPPDRQRGATARRPRWRAVPRRRGGYGGRPEGVRWRRQGRFDPRRLPRSLPAPGGRRSRSPSPALRAPSPAGRGEFGNETALSAVLPWLGPIDRLYSWGSFPFPDETGRFTRGPGPLPARCVWSARVAKEICLW